MKRFSIKPSAVKLAEGKPETRVQVIRCGKFHHEQYGVFDVTSETLRSFKKNFEEQVRGIDLAIDYKHASEDIAAGWIKGLTLENNDTELWAEVEWTPKGNQVLADKEFRYLSADFSFDYKDNETLKAFGPTLLGAGLTNRPVVKRMDPVIELSEGKGNTVDPKDQQIADLQKQCDELKAALAAKDGEMGEMKTKLGEFEAKSKEQEEKIAAAEQTGQFNKMLSEGKVVEAQREAFMKKDFAKFSELAQPTKTTAIGTGGTPAPTEGKDVEDQIIELANKKLADKSAKDFASAVSMVLSENKELAEKRNK